MNTEKLHPVIVTEIKATSDPETFQVRLEQIFDREVSTQSGLLSFTMEGHEKFQSGTKVKRVAFQNFAKAKIEELKIKVGTNFSALKGVERAKLVVTETTVPRTWYDTSSGELKSQQPKRAGKDGEILTYQGQPIYRNVALAINAMSFEDKLIAHDNQVAGSSNVNAAEAKAVENVPAEALGDPEMPF